MLYSLYIETSGSTCKCFYSNYNDLNFMVDKIKTQNFTANAQN